MPFIGGGIMFDFFYRIPGHITPRFAGFQTGCRWAHFVIFRVPMVSIEGFFDPLLWFLIWLEKLLVVTHGLILIVVGGLAYLGS